MSNSLYWKFGRTWGASTSEILSEEASEESGHSTDFVWWIPTDWQWKHSASEILTEQALEESGQSSDDF
ncbi:hypothetical protein L210DRAFT_3644141 [Boletus edulis BED1]|uniref:Uncharacterized protein n=1 Tax=Boletus edulis BED1 TaxID=1328754 RepID=A0AAD4GHY3_BOLED|nr:hypothetical protein L210DRAFT_3644141 [Boletus edulis BED1]